jgi:hypothetical protein
MAIYDQKCKLSKRTNRQISLALFQCRLAVDDALRLRVGDAVVDDGIAESQLDMVMNQPRSAADDLSQARSVTFISRKV